MFHFDRRRIAKSKEDPKEDSWNAKWNSVVSRSATQSFAQAAGRHILYPVHWTCVGSGVESRCSSFVIAFSQLHRLCLNCYGSGNIAFSFQMSTQALATSAATTLAGSRAPSAHLVSVDRPEASGEKGTLAPGPGSEDEKDPGSGSLDSNTQAIANRYPENVVGWDGPDDPECPRNWPVGKKLFFVMVTSSVIAAVSFGSSVFGPAAKVTAAEFGVAVIVMRLAVALWILGFFAGMHSPIPVSFQVVFFFWHLHFLCQETWIEIVSLVPIMIC